MKRLATLFLFISLISCSVVKQPVKPVLVSQPIAVAPTPKLPPWLLYLPGIAGVRSLDTNMIDGLQQGGYAGELKIYDWTGSDAGLQALLDADRNKQQSQLVADLITKRFDADPIVRIILACHSGGAGIAVWALEDLPARVKIDTLLFLAPALSPGYDLSRALSHVNAKAYAFWSPQDPVLGFGTKMFGTIDGVKTEAAGRTGFIPPVTADLTEYEKLVQIRYNPDWIRLDNSGDHVGTMTHKFARVALAPLLLSGKLPPSASTTPATQPTSQIKAIR